MKFLSVKEKALVALGIGFTIAFGVATVTVVTEIVIKVISTVATM